MCTRFYLTAPIELLRVQFAARGGIPHPPRFNISPTQPVVIVRLQPGMEATRTRELALVRWGLLPHWVKQPAEFGTLMTARAETAAEKPSFKVPMRHRRCIVPANGWYAWRGKTGAKRAFMIRPARPDGPPLAFAALWEHWLGPEGSEMETMAVVTVPAGPDVEAVDERMPALLEGSAIDAWLDARATAPEQATALLRPAPAGTVLAEPITDAINNPTAEGAQVQMPLAPRES